jgi:hypothetical protein
MIAWLALVYYAVTGKGSQLDEAFVALAIRYLRVVLRHAWASRRPVKTAAGSQPALKQGRTEHGWWWFLALCWHL